MKRNIFGLVASAVYIVIILLSAKMFEKSEKEASRKYIHIMLSNWWIIAMIFFNTPIFACIGPAIFIIINYISYKYNLIKSMEREKDKQDGLGTVYYAISLFILAYLTFGPLNNTLIGLCSIIVMGYADGMAAIVGKSLKSPSYTIGNTTKTLAGSLTMLVITFIIISGFLVFNNVPFWFFKAIIISFIITIIEAISIKGTDNLTVPLVTAGLLFLI
ncbi:MAG: diacylglycerol/polyprenol kinase family protein [Candidatus Scatovivens sp.]